MTVFLFGVAAGVVLTVVAATAALAFWEVRSDVRREALLQQRARRGGAS